MALIVCNKCGKKYSDSVSCCIHCGNPTFVQPNDPPADVLPPSENTVQAETISTQSSPVTAPKNSDKDIIDTAPQKKSYTNYYDLPNDYVAELEAEFLAQNEWALRYEQKRQANIGFGNAFLLFIATSVTAMILMFNGSFLIVNEAILPIAIFWNLAILLIGIVGAIVCVARIFILSFNKKAKEWSKSFQAWLKEEKNIIMED